MQCPRCKGEMPLLSKICPQCQHVIEGDKTAPKAEEMVNTLERILLDIKNLPKPSFGDSLQEMLYIAMPVLTLYFIVLGLISGAGFFWIIGGAGGVMTVFTSVRKIMACIKPAPKMLDMLKNQYEYNEQIAHRNFGKNPEVWRHISAITGEISEVETAHYVAKRHNLYLWVIIGVCFLILGSGGAVTTSIMTSRAAEQAPALWEQKIEAYKTSSDNSDYGDNGARIAVLNEILASKEFDAAEKFFFEYSQGKVGDVDCARVIMRAYMADGKTDLAMGFANRVVLRYASDAIKLKKILNDNGTVQQK